MRKEIFKDGLKTIRLWVHECDRVFRDRLINDSDAQRYDEFRTAVTKKYFESDGGGMANILAVPNIYTSFMTFSADDEPLYNAVPGTDSLRKALEDKLAEYNESNAVMDLVLFQQAMEHVTRIARIVALPGGNAMLVGVGGSGKQSLARLASFICGYDVFQISVSSTYGLADFKENWLALYTKAGMKVRRHLLCGLFLSFRYTAFCMSLDSARCFPCHGNCPGCLKLHC